MGENQANRDMNKGRSAVRTDNNREMLKKAGFVTGDEVASMLGRVSGDHTRDVLLTAGLIPIYVPLGGKTGKWATLWNLTDVLEYVESVNKKNKPVAGENNGGRLRRDIFNLQQTIVELTIRIDALESAAISQAEFSLKKAQSA